MTKWKCPKCGATVDKHGKGGASACRHGSFCGGFVCECTSVDSDERDHGTSLANPCPEARCYHCEWMGTVPRVPKRMAPWEKKALEAGWVPPAARKKELGIT